MFHQHTAAGYRPVEPADYEAACFAAGRTWRRNRRYALQAVAGAILKHEKVAICGRHAREVYGEPDGGMVAVKRAGNEGHAHYSGPIMCGSTWVCPVCALRNAAGRREQVERAVERHIAAGGAVFMATFTMPHHAMQSAKALREGVAEAWRKVQAGKAWVERKREAGFVGSVRALEVTHGANGWHPHLHVLLFFEDHAGGLGFGSFLFARWAGIVAGLGFGDCNPEVWDYRPAKNAEAAADYISKWGTAAELVGALGKKAKGGHRNPWQILEAVMHHRRAADAELFAEYARAFKGARQLTWSKGLKDLYEVDDPGDEELANRDPGGETVVLVDSEGWRLVWERGLTAALLDAAERYDYRQLVDVMEGLGIPRRHFHRPSPPKAPHFDPMTFDPAPVVWE